MGIIYDTFEIADQIIEKMNAECADNEWRREGKRVGIYRRSYGQSDITLKNYIECINQEVKEPQ